MIDEFIEIPSSLLKILKAVLVLPTANILDDISRAYGFDTVQISSERLDNVDRLESVLGNSLGWFTMSSMAAAPLSQAVRREAS